MVCIDNNHMNSFLKEIESLGGEGIMLRRSKSRYEGKRSSTLLKVKSFLDEEALVIAHNPGTGRHKGRMGSLQCRIKSGKEFRIGTGFSDKIRDSPPSVGSIVTFRFQEYTKGGIPRFPSYVGICVDKKV